MRIMMIAVISMVVSLFAVNSFAGDQHKLRGVVKAIKTDANKLTISHGPIKSLGMDGMTMDFGVYDPSMLDEVSKGHKISAVIEEDRAGNFVIMEIEDQGMASGSMANGDGHNHSH